MSEAVDQNELTLTPFDTRPVGGALLRADRQFNFALVIATVAHLLFLTSFISAEVRQLGDPGGAQDGISVDFVTEADLQRMGTVADKAAGAPAPPPPPPEQAADRPPPTPTPPPPQQTASLPPEPPPPEPQAQEKPAPEAQQTTEPPPPEPRAPAPEEPSPPSPPEPQAQPTAVPPDPALEQLLKIPTQAALPHSLDPPKPLKPPEPAKPARPAQPEEARRPQPKQRVRTSALDLSLPPTLFTAPSGGGGAGVERPAGITRSGENDAFARGVIAALQRTMPQLRETRGRVTVRIILDKDGSIVRTEVVRPSSVANLDQSVVFATRQASFPFPPRNANSADLTFLVTYIYR